ncbi:MAG: RpiB/LacA/LacB family sugar-phosphate isomerase [Anaerolineales bacterium]
MKLAIGSDQNGYTLKKALIESLHTLGHEVIDLGCDENEIIDYPDVAEKLGLAVATGDFERGILICGTGIGMALVANKIPGVRAAQIADIYSAERAAKSNNANIITFGAQVIGIETANALALTWLNSEFEGGRSLPKVEKVERIDQHYRAKS